MIENERCSLMEEMKDVFMDLEGVFDAFSFPYRVDELRGVIHLSLSVKIKSREIIKNYDLRLPRKISYDPNLEIFQARLRIDKLRELIGNERQCG